MDTQHTIQNTPLSIHLCVLYVAVLYGGVVVSYEKLLGELNGEGTLAHSPISHHHQLICQQVVIWGPGHGSSPTPTYGAHSGCSCKAAWAASCNNSVMGAFSPAIKWVISLAVYMKRLESSELLSHTDWKMAVTMEAAAAGLFKHQYTFTRLHGITS